MSETGWLIHFEFVTDHRKTACGANGHTTNSPEHTTCQACLDSPLMSRSNDAD